MPKNSQMPSQNSGERIDYLSLNSSQAFRLTLKEFIFGHQNSNTTIGGFKQNYIYDLITDGNIEPTTIDRAYEPDSTLSHIASSPCDWVFWLLHSNADRHRAEAEVETAPINPDSNLLVNHLMSFPGRARKHH